MALEVWLPEDPEGDFARAVAAAAGATLLLHIGPDLPAGADPRILVRGVPTREQLERCPRLASLIIPYAGIPQRTRFLLGEFPNVQAHNLHHNAASTAELALALLLALSKRLLPLDAALRRGDWRPRYEPTEARRLEGATALVLGYGAIGRRVARGCRGLGMQVLATRRRIEAVQDAGEGIELHPPAALEDLLPRADALLITLPATSETEGLLGAQALRRLPRHALLVNVGRGAVIEEEALYAVLRDGHIAGAGLDVWYRYPHDESERESTLPSAFPFHELENVVLSPHRAGHAHDNESLRARALLDLLTQAAEGRTMDNLVDLDAGY